MALAAATVAETLRAEATRARTLDALEAHVPPIPRELALAAAPALVDIAAGTEDRATFDRSALMVARLLDEAPDPSAVHGAAFAGERFAAYKGPRLMTEATQRALVEGGEPLTQADARSYACLCAWENPSVVHWVHAGLCSGWAHRDGVPGHCKNFRPRRIPHALRARPILSGVGARYLAAPLCSLIRWWAQVKSVEPMQSKQMPSEAVPLQMLVLLVEMLRAEELPELAVGGAFGAVHQCLHRPGLAPMAMELGVIHLAAEHLREMGSPADAVSVSRGRAGPSILDHWQRVRHNTVVLWTIHPARSRRVCRVGCLRQLR
eukprot:COSAG06_NODE_658_length_13322_cov_3.396430_6_plen_320_part_00